LVSCGPILEELTKKKSKGRRKQRKGNTSPGSQDAPVEEREKEDVVVSGKKPEGKLEEKVEVKAAPEAVKKEKKKQEKGKVDTLPKKGATDAVPEKKKSKKSRGKNKEGKKTFAEKGAATKAVVEESKLEEKQQRKEQEEPVLASASRDADPSEMAIEDPEWHVVKRKGRRSTHDTGSDLDESSAPVVPQPKEQPRTRSTRRAMASTAPEEGKRPPVDDDPWDLGSAKEEASSERRVDVDAFLEEHYGRSTKESAIGGPDSIAGRVRVSVEQKHQQKDIWTQKASDVPEVCESIFVYIPIHNSSGEVRDVFL
jgi:hypothetical protein